MYKTLPVHMLRHKEKLSASNEKNSKDLPELNVNGLNQFSKAVSW